MRCVATVRDNPDIVYAAILGGGVYKSTNGGSSWVQLQNQSSNLYIMRIAINPADPDIVWVGCLRNTQQVIHRSQDGGDSWSGFTIGGQGHENLLSVSDIAIADDQIIYVATYNVDPIWPDDPEENEGVLRTTDGGESWAREITGMDANYVHVRALAVV